MKGAGVGFDVFDFRPDYEYVVNDRSRIDAQWKVMSGLLEFEADRLGALGFADLGAGLRAAAESHTSRAHAWASYAERSLRNLEDFGHWLFAGRRSLKAASTDSASSSFAGYSRAYELISYFAEPSWFGWVAGKLTRGPMLLHHLRNMELLAELAMRRYSTKVLEVGCGSAVNLLLLQQLCGLSGSTRLSGFDYPVSRLLTARATVEHFGLNLDVLALADVRRMPFADASFDIVFSHYVIEQMAGMEEQVLGEMLRVSRSYVVMFETGLYRPTLDQRLFMRHSGYSTALPEIVRRRHDVELERIENLRSDRFYGCPNILMILRKRQAG